jgi:hypothetical protein
VLQINGRAHTVVGVMPEGSGFRRIGTVDPHRRSTTTRAEARGFAVFGRPRERNPLTAAAEIAGVECLAEAS